MRHPFIRGSALGEGLTIRVEQGQLFAVVGASGSGKTTLLRICLGLIAPADGAVELREQPGRPTRAGVVFQSPEFLPWRNVADNVRAPLPKEMPRAYQRQEAGRALDRAALPYSSHLFPDQLSGGMRARAALARALVNDPLLLVLDEPFASLDAALAEDLNDLLVALTGGGLGILFVTQDLDRMLFRADQALVLGQGSLGINPVIDLNERLGPAEAGRSVDAVASLRSRIIETMRHPLEEPGP
ncbi:MAG: ATP-binding cassette domain-containing protein [Allosphingosinicella sp.]